MSGLDEQIGVLAQGALALAVARYLHDHPRKRRKAKGWIDAEVDEWRERDPEAIGAEASHRLDVLEEWVEEAKEQEPDVYETRRIDSVHARMALQSARSGAFGTAAGSLADFLRAVGERPDELQLG